MKADFSPKRVSVVRSVQKWRRRRTIPGRTASSSCSETAQQSTCVPTVRMSPCKSVSSSTVSPPPSLRPSHPVTVSCPCRAWKLTLLETRRNPVSSALQLLSTVSVSLLQPEVLPPAGVRLRPVRWLLPDGAHEQVSDGLHHTRSGTRYVNQHSEDLWKILTMNDPHLSKCLDNIHTNLLCFNCRFLFIGIYYIFPALPP